MEIRLTIKFEVDDERPEVEGLGAKLVREQAEAFACAVKRALTEAGLEVTGFHAEYE